MSRIGKLPVNVPSGVDVKVSGREVSVKGPKGELRRTFHPLVTVDRADATLRVVRANESQQAKAIHGLSRSLLANMVEGVSTGYVRDLEISGTGYRATRSEEHTSELQSQSNLVCRLLLE